MFIIQLSSRCFRRFIHFLDFFSACIHFIGTTTMSTSSETDVKILVNAYLDGHSVFVRPLTLNGSTSGEMISAVRQVDEKLVCDSTKMERVLVFDPDWDDFVDHDGCVDSGRKYRVFFVSKGKPHNLSANIENRMTRKELDKKARTDSTAREAQLYWNNFNITVASLLRTRWHELQGSRGLKRCAGTSIGEAKMNQNIIQEICKEAESLHKTFTLGDKVVCFDNITVLKYIKTHINESKRPESGQKIPLMHETSEKVACTNRHEKKQKKAENFTVKESKGETEISERSNIGTKTPLSPISDESADDNCEQESYETRRLKNIEKNRKELAEKFQGEGIDNYQEEASAGNNLTKKRANKKKVQKMPARKRLQLDKEIVDFCTKSDTEEDEDDEKRNDSRLTKEDAHAIICMWFGKKRIVDIDYKQLKLEYKSMMIGESPSSKCRLIENLSQFLVAKKFVIISDKRPLSRDDIKIME
ncbi:uncharacterized protein [Ptychodera flava]|uniref:uncharacterized protein isoform X2 n=1 Tax=Ptychodera flava TaxID=63121 RepID=UPI003969BC59